MLKLSCSYDSERFMLLKIGTEWVIQYTVTFCDIFQFLTMFKTIVGTGAVGAGATLCYGSGSDQNDAAFAAPAPQHC
jgi:hypothetical protein